MKRIFINDRPNPEMRGEWGMAVVVVVAENAEEAHWLTRDIEAPMGEPVHLFDRKGWRVLEGAEPSYLQTEPKILSLTQYWE